MNGHDRSQDRRWSGGESDEKVAAFGLASGADDEALDGAVSGAVMKASIFMASMGAIAARA
ncbi:hypothetical protein FH975_16000 [Nesterenkonia sp. Hz 6-5]|nr:hypothetical protein [Nesterenkonia haasae]